MIVKDMAVEQAKPEFRELVRRSLNEAENFFKHADKDPDAMLKFLAVQTEYLIFDAEVMYQKLTGRVSASFLAFRGWFVMTHQSVFNFSAEEMKLIEGYPADIIKRGRSEYFSEILPLASLVAKRINGDG